MRSIEKRKAERFSCQFPAKLWVQKGTTDGSTVNIPSQILDISFYGAMVEILDDDLKYNNILWSHMICQETICLSILLSCEKPAVMITGEMAWLSSRNRSDQADTNKPQTDTRPSNLKVGFRFDTIKSTALKEIEYFINDNYYNQFINEPDSVDTIIVI